MPGRADDHRADAGAHGCQGPVAVDIGPPLVVFYGLRALGVGIHPALIAGALGSAATATVSLLRHRRVDGSAALYGATSLLLIVITNVYYALAGVYDEDSALYRRAGAPVHASRAGTEE